MRKNIKVKKISRLQKIRRAHAVFFLIIFGLYTALSAILTPSFMLSDMRTKSKALADETITILGKVLGPPATPIISGSAVCDAGNLSISLSWPTDEGSQTFDITRDGLTLITGLTDPNYTDTTIVIDNSYSYVVTAHGPMGSGLAVSLPHTITTPIECNVPLPTPTEKITIFQLKATTSYSETPRTSSLRPSFSGTTNIANARIDITLESGPIVYGTTTANAAGYWSWATPVDMDLGSHTIYTTATDPLNAILTATDVFHFEIVTTTSTTSSQKNNTEHKKNKTTQEISAPAPLPTPTTTAPFTLAVVITNPEHSVYAGSDLSFQVNFLKKSSSLLNQDYEIFYTVLDADDQVVAEISEKINPTHTNSVNKNILIPILSKAGHYKIIAKTYVGRDAITGEDSFQVKELPLISVGTTTVSLADIMRGLGWLSLWFLLLFLFLLGIEYYQSREGLFQITENYLQKKGFITRRKGVQR